MQMQEASMICTETELEDYLSTPSPQLIEEIKQLEGDIIILGIAGKMGITLGMMAKKAIQLAGIKKKVIGVARFSDQAMRVKLNDNGIETIKCDLLNPTEVNQLPLASNVIYMAGKKFGTDGAEDLTWAMNVTAPSYVANHYKNSRIVAFSTGCVYPLVSPESGGCTEETTCTPIGDYAQSSLGRERVFSYHARLNKTPTLLLRLNYAIDLRYGVLSDIGTQIWNDQPVTNSVGYFNVIWQGDANNYALRSLSLCQAPAIPLNITGPETVSINYICQRFSQLMNKKVTYTQDVPGQTCYLNNSAKAFKHFDYPSVTLEKMIEWQANWIMQGGSNLNKPTHFEVNNGKF